MTLAIFDLDNTLLAGDSDQLWGQFLLENGLVDNGDFGDQNDQFYLDYKSGTLDITAYLRFSLGTLKGHSRQKLDGWHRQFMRDVIEPIILPQGQQLVEQHRQRGDDLLIITATNAFITRPISTALGISELLASEAQLMDGKYTGEPAGVPTFREGKISRLREWVVERETSLEGAYFYSDSHNDLPLLEIVDNPVAVDPDPMLLRRAEAAGWPVMSLRGEGGLKPI